MSNTFEIACKDCKKSYWFGQRSSIGGATMYSPDKFMEWLVEHSTCGEFAIINEYAGNYPKWYSDEFKLVSNNGEVK